MTGRKNDAIVKGSVEEEKKMGEVGGRTIKISMILGTLSVVSSATFFFPCYLGGDGIGRRIGWGWICLVVCLLSGVSLRFWCVMYALTISARDGVNITQG